MYSSLWWDFCDLAWFQEVSSFSLGILFRIFSCITTCLMVSISNILRAFWSSLDLVFLFFLSFVFFRFSLIAGHIFYGKFHPYILTASSHLPELGFSILSHFWQTHWCRPCTLGGRFCSCNLWSFYPPVHFLILWLMGNTTIKNSNGDIASPWKTPSLDFYLC